MKLRSASTWRKVPLACALASLAPLASLAVTACDKKTDAGGPATVAAPASSSDKSDKAGGDGSYVLTTATVGDCRAGETCTATVRIEAQSVFHINDEYPYKLTATNVAGVDYQGTDASGKNVFSKAAGNFAKESAKVGVLTVKLKPQAKGAINVAGVYRLSVCSDATCKLDNPTVSFAVDAK
jgi:hypothetical protein